jgi:uncharacterized protein (TIGR02996 family)
MLEGCRLGREMFMTPEHAFLDSIWEDLDDDATKLIFADWLEEQEDWRGQLLRWQVERNQHGFWTPVFKQLRDQIDGRLLARGDDWLEPLANYHRGIRYSDGTGLLWLKTTPERLARLPEPRTSEGVHRWVTEASLESPSLNDVLTALERGPQVRVFVNFTRRAPAKVGQRLASAAGVERLRSLDLTFGNLEARDLEFLLAAPTLEGVQYLFFGFAHGASGVPAALLTAHHLTNLRGLDLSKCGLKDRELELLCRAPALEGLTALYLEQNHFSSVGLEALITSRYLQKLRILDLRSCHLSTDWPAVAALRQRFPFVTL